MEHSGGLQRYHFGVAFFWSAVFLFLFLRSAYLRRIVQTPAGTFLVASIVGPAIWLLMSLVVVPSLVHRAPTINIRWWIQLVGHVFFVGLPIVASIASGRREPTREAHAA